MDENVIVVFRVIDSVCPLRESNEKRGEKALDLRLKVLWCTILFPGKYNIFEVNG